MFRPLDATLLPTVPVEDYRTCIFKPLDAELLPTVPVYLNLWMPHYLL